MSNEWDAFISYSRQATRAEAEALQARIQTFAKPWNRLRSARVFRDDASMSANAGLWPTIERALIEARYFILILSPGAAASDWVNNEVQWWLDHKGQDTILLVHASGAVAWDKDVGFSAASDCVPPALRAGLRVEPRWVDLTWFSQPASTGAADPRFQEIVADLAAPIRGIERDELVGEHVSQLRRTRRLSRIAITALSILLALALVLAGVAYAQMRVAQEQTRLATVRLLTSESQRLAASNVGLSRLLAAQANSMSDDVETRRALFGSLTAGPHLVAERALEAPQALAVNPDGSVVATVDPSGSLTRWNVSSGDTEQLGTTCSGYIRRLVMSDDGTVIVGDCVGGGAFAYVSGKPMDLTGEGVIAVSPSGKTIAHLVGDDLYLTTISGTDASTTLAGTLRWSGNLIGLPSDDTLVAVDEFNSAGALIDLHSLRTVSVLAFGGSAPEYQRLLSRTGAAYWDSSKLWRLGDGMRRPHAIDPSGGYFDFVAMAISDTGDTAAYVLDEGGIEVTTPAEQAGAVTVRTRLEAGTEIGRIAIGGSHVIAAAHDGVVSIWDLRRSSPAYTSTPLPPGPALEFANTIGAADDTMVPNASGSAVAFGNGYRGFSVIDERGESLFEAGSSGESAAFLGWRSDTALVYFASGEVREYDISARRLVQAQRAPGLRHEGFVGGWDARAGQAILSNGHGAYLRVDLATGRSTELSTSGRRVKEFSRNGARVILMDGNGGKHYVLDSSLKQQLFVHDGSVTFTENDDLLVVEGNEGRNNLVSMTGAGTDVPLVWNWRGTATSAFLRLPVSPDGATYLTTAVRGYALMLSTAASQEVGKVPLRLVQDDASGEWAHGSFSGDGKRIFLIARKDDFTPMITVVDIAPDRMIEAACHTVRRSLEPDEWERMTGVAPPGDLVCQDSSSRLDSPAPSASGGGPTANPGSGAGEPPSTQGVSGWVTVLDSKPKAESGSHAAAADMAAAMTASSGAKVEVLDTDAYPALTPGYWAVVLTGSTTETEARTACARVSREPGPACYPRSLG